MNCIVKLAFLGQGVFKEIAPIHDEDTDPDPHARGDSASSDEEKDLCGTGLLSDDDTKSDEYDSDSRVNDFDSTDEDNGENSKSHEDENDVDQMDGHDAASKTVQKDIPYENGKTTDAYSDVDKMEEHDVASNTVEKDIPSENDHNPVLVHDDEDDEGHDSDVVFTGISMPPKPTPNLLGCVHRSREYTCYLCSFKSQMQVTFTKHFQDTHPTDYFQCDFFYSKFASPNGLFKHERSHQYMKFRCQLCTYRLQFPYQLKAHHNTHIETDEFQCETCGKNFASKGSKQSHVKTHTTKIICPDCPAGTSKTYTSNNAFHHHKRGKHGPG